MAGLVTTVLEKVLIALFQNKKNFLKEISLPEDSRESVLPRIATVLFSSWGITSIISKGLQRLPPHGREIWARTNHRGEELTLLEGPAFVVGAVSSLFVAPGLSSKFRMCSILVTGTAGIVGLVDDLGEQGSYKGFTGHLKALANRKISTGMLKVLALSASGIIASALVTHETARSKGSSVHHPKLWFDILIGGGIIAGSSNLINLMDLRPGRALKIVLVSAPASIGSGPAAIPIAVAVGAAAALLPDDLNENTMLGDTGANAAGALLGLAVVQGLSIKAQYRVFASLVALTALSEKISFSKIINDVPVLAKFDNWGRRKA